MKKSPVIARRRVYTGKVTRVDEIDLDFGNGNTPTYELVTFDVVTGVSALPVQDDEVWLISHYHVGIDAETYSLPSGGLHAEEDPAERMQLELQEELGYRANKLTLLLRTHSMPGYVGTEPGYLYVASELEPSRLPGDEEYPITIERLKLTQALEMIKEGKIVDGRTMLALLYYARMIQFPYYE
jgi:8-oxo-dGTP pyrophosphatase MutT (NUDIX family)